MATGGKRGGRASRRQNDSVDDLITDVDSMTLNVDVSVHSERYLKSRIKNLTLSRSDISECAEWVNKMIVCVLDELRRKNPHLGWKDVRSGSYYDKTKIFSPNEFDVMLTCEIRAKKSYNPSDGPLGRFCTLQPVTDDTLFKPHEILTHDAKPYICPKAFMAWFRKDVTEVVRDLRKNDPLLKKHDVVIPHHKDGSPAVVVKIDYVSVDIVPGIRIMEWPRPARNWTSRYLGELRSADIRGERDTEAWPFAVAKIHPSEAGLDSGSCKQWRISFSTAEKIIILGADGYNKPTEEKTCRKDVLRLLKDDIENLNETICKDRKALSSYHAKTVLLHCLDEFTRDDDWSHITDRYVAALNLMVEYLERRVMPHYFINGVNIIEESLLSKTRWNEVVQYFKDLVRKYDVTSG